MQQLQGISTRLVLRRPIQSGVCAAALQRASRGQGILQFGVTPRNATAYGVRRRRRRFGLPPRVNSPSRRLAAIWLAAAALALAGCEPGKPGSAVSTPDLTYGNPRMTYRNPRDRENWVSSILAGEMIREDPNLQVLCVANIEDYRAGHLPNSMLIPVTGLRLAVDDNTLYESINHGRTPRKDRPLLVYCWWNTCHCPSVPTFSELARQILREKGFTDVYSIEGGMLAWKAEGMPYEKTELTTSVAPPTPAAGRAAGRAADYSN